MYLINSVLIGKVARSFVLASIVYVQYAHGGAFHPVHQASKVTTNAVLLTIHRTGSCQNYWLLVDSGSGSVASEALKGSHCQRLESLE